jgi:hypothetical protein
MTKFLVRLTWVLIGGGGLAMFLGMINDAVESIGAIYYWEAVWAGYVSFAAIYMFRIKKGYKLRGHSVYSTPACLVMGAVALPNCITIFLPIESWQGVQGVAWLTTIGAFSIIASCGFTGTKTPSKESRLAK